MRLVPRGRAGAPLRLDREHAGVDEEIQILYRVDSRQLEASQVAALAEVFLSGDGRRLRHLVVLQRRQPAGTSAAGRPGPKVPVSTSIRPWLFRRPACPMNTEAGQVTGLA
ncbi:MAG: hypothetical protein M3Y33_09960 [Actinomycetota bacterium]|nr:hypothetical protein [Actinomycetota bacterium]